MAHRMNILAVALFCVVLGACALFKSTAKTVVDVALATCIAEHPDVHTPEAMQKVCPYVEEFGPIVAELLAARKRGLARVAAERGPVVYVLVTDAGSDAGK